ncbi:MAG: flavodoxin [Clostridiales bacterium]|jgi:menaquinone-dependent protoporphyrinogen oxidase|nr:flavodoxin [Clostridiales bacterium]
MKILIAYAGISGTTEKCAGLLADNLDSETVDIVDLCAKTPVVTDYDTVVIGSNIHMGRIHKAVQKFINDNHAELSGGRAAYFFCCGFADKKDEIIQLNYPKHIKDNAVAIECFGGEMDINRLRGINKFIAKMVTKASAAQKVEPPSIKHDRIEALAKAIKG